MYYTYTFVCMCVCIAVFLSIRMLMFCLHLYIITMYMALAADILHTTVANVTDTAILTCSANGINRINGIFYPTLNWTTTVHGNGVGHLSNERININESVNTQSNIVVSTLAIHSVQLEDDGSYICTTLFGGRTAMLTVYDLIVGM